MKPSDYIKARAKIDKKYREEVDCLEKAWRIINDTPPPSVRAHMGPNSPAEKGLLIRKIRNVMPVLNGNFSVLDVRAKLDSESPELRVKNPSISQTLNRLCKEGSIELTVQGKGKRASLYQRKV